MKPRALFTWGVSMRTSMHGCIYTWLPIELKGCQPLSSLLKWSRHGYDIRPASAPISVRSAHRSPANQNVIHLIHPVWKGPKCGGSISKDIPCVLNETRFQIKICNIVFNICSTYLNSRISCVNIFVYLNTTTFHITVYGFKTGMSYLLALQENLSWAAHKMH